VVIAALELPATLTAREQTLVLRRAGLGDLDALMALLADDLAALAEERGEA
jgi:hypothetical protein